jgi:uncharacterized membrane protein YjjP (DUF1212 family)
VTEVAGRYGAEVEVAFLPDVAILTSGDRTTSRAATPVVPPLHQVSALKRVLAAIAGGDLPAAEAVRRIDAVRRLPPRFGTPARVAGLVLFSVGFGISLQATWQEVVASGVLGLLVGLVVVTTEPHPRLALAAPFAASVAVAVLALVAVDQGWVHGGPIPLMVPALFYFIPGDALAAAMLELAAGRITAGASRLTLPPPYVLYLGAFYVLTPGSVGLRGLESWIGGARVQGLSGLAEMAGLLAAIAVGMLVGTALVPRPLASGM